ncbi:RDD family protein [Ferrimonas lipolytica]|uniref:RDD family protein n=1 Tax=Ferrimonas lipolytica TaxID=2724191 RepID=A0A6H1UB44_9GAMM|nr:RDD family protein [Ferrimonas lipolytica]QIZ75426.1 RDD family protein [Ferrimonas lipolytica]
MINTVQAEHSAQTVVDPTANIQAKTAALHPWRRLFARTVDILLLAPLLLFLLVLIMAWFAPVLTDDFINSLSNPIVAGVVLYLLWLPVEALCLSTFKSTPAKALFGITVTSHQGDNLSFTQALQRGFHLLLKGEALALPVANFVARIFAYFDLKKHETTRWDNAVGSVVSHKKWQPLRALLCVIAVGITLAFISVLGAM